jgi:hypothetical protein
MAQGYQFSFIKRDLLIGHDASTVATPFQSVCSNYTWNITICFDSITGGTPIVKIEVSNDGTEFFDYNSCAANETTDKISFFDSILAFPYIRLNYDPNGVTGGTVDASLILKPI